MTNKCKTCMHGYPNVECVNCGTGFRNYLPYTPPTNADRIRSLNDDELAEYIFELGNYAEYCYDHCAYSGDNALCKERSNNGRNHDGCLRGVIDWLQQPAKE